MSDAHGSRHPGDAAELLTPLQISILSGVLSEHPLRLFAVHLGLTPAELAEQLVLARRSLGVASTAQALRVAQAAGLLDESPR